MSARTYACVSFLGLSVLTLVASLWYRSMVGEATYKETGLTEAELQELDPFALGEYYFNQDEDTGGPYDLEKAREYYKRVIEADPKGHNRVWYQLGRLDFVEGRLFSAVYKFNKQIEYFGDALPNAHYMLGLSHAYIADRYGNEGEWQLAEDEMKIFLQYTPTSPWSRVDLGWIYFSQGKYKEMIPLLEEGLLYEPDHAWLLNTYGLALLNTGEALAAYEVFEKAQASAAKLTVEDWAAAYRGNDPKDWKKGLREFRNTIDRNLKLAQTRL